MTQSSPATAVKANGRGYSPAVIRSQPGTAQSILSKFFNEKIGRQRKPWPLLCVWLGIDEHTAKHRLAERRDFSPDDIVTALRGELGGDLLAAIMGDSKAAWYAKYKRTLDIANLRKLQADHQRLLEKLEQDAAE